MKPDDLEDWSNFIKTVVPLGDPKPCVPVPIDVPEDFVSPTNIDLHGMTIAQAFETTAKVIHDAHKTKVKKLTIVTGVSGNIRQEFPEWMKLNILVRGFKNKNEGSFEVYIMK